jgi:hypothetical protein
MQQGKIVVALYKILITNSTECPIVPYTYICSALLTIKDDVQYA